MFEFLKKYTDSNKLKTQVGKAVDKAADLFDKSKKDNGMSVKIGDTALLKTEAPMVAATASVKPMTPTVGAGLTIKPITEDKQPEIKSNTEVAIAPKIDATEKPESNVFTDLFPTNDKTKTNDKLVESLNASTQTKSILKPTKNDSDLLIYKKPVLGSNLLKLTILIVLLTFSYFYTQLSPTFNLLGGQNPVQKEMSSYERVLSLQSKINKQNYILAKYALDDFLYTADSYLHKTALYTSPLTSQKDKLQIEKEFPSLRAKMRDNLFLASDMLSYKIVPDALPANLNKDISYDQEFKKALKDEIRTSITAISNDLEQVEFMRTVSRLVDNTTIKPALNSYKIQTMTDDQFADMLSLLSDSNTSNFGTLNKLRHERVKWSSIIDEIEKVTKSIDPLFGSKFAQDNVGEIFYSSYTLDKAKNSISVVGETLSDDGKNFSLSSDLLDAFEKSPLFSNVSMDSFSKSKEQDTSYKGVLTIDLTLEQ